jgi:hypothetical protein
MADASPFSLVADHGTEETDPGSWRLGPVLREAGVAVRDEGYGSCT